MLDREYSPMNETKSIFVKLVEEDIHELNLKFQDKEKRTANLVEIFKPVSWKNWNIVRFFSFHEIIGILKSYMRFFNEMVGLLE